MASAGRLDQQLLDVLLYLGSEWVLYLLLVLSVFSVALTLERFIHFIRNRVDVDELRTRWTSISRPASWRRRVLFSAPAAATSPRFCSRGWLLSIAVRPLSRR